MSCPRSPWLRPYLFGAAIAIGAIAAITTGIFWTKPERDSFRAYSDLIAAANRQDVSSAQSLCSARYLRTHSLRPAPEGGLVGLPRNIHKNFKVWRHQPNVWLCPTDQVGPLYQFVVEDGRWKFDGPIGILQPRGRIVLLKDETAAPAGEAPE